MHTIFRMLMTAVAALAAGGAAPCLAGGLRIGRAAVDITPEVGTPLLTPQRPPFEIKLATAPHDPLHVKAIVMDQGDVRVALVACDLTSIPLEMIREARRLVDQRTEIAPDHVMISATHCHTAPQIRPKYLFNADGAAREKTKKYIAALPQKMAKAVAAAEADLTPAQASAGVGQEGGVSFNRRFFLRDGTVQANPFKDEDEKLGQILRPAGPIDPEVGVIQFANDARVPLAVMTNFAIHLDTVGGDQPSADFPFMVDQALKAVVGPQVLSFWASGASGNINHYDLTDPVRFRREKGIHEATRIGTILAAEVLRTARRLEPQQDAPLRTAREVVRLDYHPEKAEALRARMKETPRYFDGEVDVFDEDGKLSFDAEVQVIALGNEIAWVGLPGEMFTEFGLAVKHASPFRYTMVHSLANGAIGYVPNLRAYPEGAREAEATRCAPGSGERLVEAATRLLVKLKAEGPS
jgi:neutral ceramidase